jgi:hypothetical protein
LAFEERRNAELAEVQRLEDAERRRTEEKERRLAEQIRILKEKQESAEKISARAFAQSYLANLVPSVIENLSTNGYFYDTVEKEVETLFLPWLSVEVGKSLDRLTQARALVDGTCFYKDLFFTIVAWMKPSTVACTLFPQKSLLLTVLFIFANLQQMSS